MKTILIAHGDEAFAEQLESQLHNGGYRVISCRGPWRRTGACIRGTRRLARYAGYVTWAPHVHAAANGPARLLRQIHDLLVPTPQPTALLERAPATVR